MPSLAKSVRTEDRDVPFDMLNLLFPASTYNLQGVNDLLRLHCPHRNETRTRELPREETISKFKNMNKPIEISLPEWEEIMNVREVKEGWGFDEDATPQECRSLIYGVKFDFVSGGPGYCGDLYILQGDSLEAPLVLIRDKGQLRVSI